MSCREFFVENVADDDVDGVVADDDVNGVVHAKAVVTE